MRSPNPFCVDQSSQHLLLSNVKPPICFGTEDAKGITSSEVSSSNMSRGSFLLSASGNVFNLPSLKLHNVALAMKAFPSNDLQPWHGFQSLIFVRIHSSRWQSPVIPATPRISNHFTASINSYNTAAAGSPVKKGATFRWRWSCFILQLVGYLIPSNQNCHLGPRLFTSSSSSINYLKCERMQQASGGSCLIASSSLAFSQRSAPSDIIGSCSTSGVNLPDCAMAKVKPGTTRKSTS